MTLAEILEVAERLDRVQRPWEFRTFWKTHGPRLVAVARAAVEMVAAEDDADAPHTELVCHMGPGDCEAGAAQERRYLRLRDARVALRAALAPAASAPEEGE